MFKSYRSSQAAVHDDRSPSPGYVRSGIDFRQVFRFAFVTVVQVSQGQTKLLRPLRPRNMKPVTMTYQPRRNPPEILRAASASHGRQRRHVPPGAHDNLNAHLKHKV